MKADMFSAGVILYEMCHSPFSTGMERIEKIKALRNTGAASIKQDKSIDEKVKGLISFLVDRNPTTRYSASQILASQQMPPRLNLDRGYLKEVTAALATPQSDTAQEILTALFHQSSITSDQDEVRFFRTVLSSQSRLLEPINISGPSLSSQTPQQNQLVVQKVPLQLLETVSSTLSRVFEVQGAVRFKPYELQPRLRWDDSSDSTHIKDSKAEFIDRNGILVALPNNLITPFAYFASRAEITCSLRYLIDNVFVKRKFGHPTQQTEAVFDIIREVKDYRGSHATAEMRAISKRSTISFAEVEVLTTTFRSINALGLNIPFVLRINDNRMVSSLLELCGVLPSHPMFDELCKLFSRTVSTSLQSISVAGSGSGSRISEALAGLDALGHNVEPGKSLGENQRRAIRPILKVLAEQDNIAAVLHRLAQVS